MNKPNALGAPSSTPIIIFGRDEASKPHASKFHESDFAAVVKAAALMRYRALWANDDKIAEIAKALPDGKLFESGKCFVPFVKLDLCSQLERYADANPERVAVYDGPSGTATDGPSDDAKAEDDATLDNDLIRPKDWGSITEGSVVLAVDVPEDGWWEAEVTHVHESGTTAKSVPILTLKWRMWPDDGTFVRRFDHVALLHPTPEGRAGSTDDAQPNDS